MKSITGKVTSITQGENAGTVQIKTTDATGKVKYIVMVQCTDAKEVKEFEHNKEITVSFTPKK